MFKHWLISDIEDTLKRSDCVVISDPSRFLTFMVKELTDYAVITLNSPADEMNSRLQAKTSHSDSKVIFLCFFPSKNILQLLEFSGIGGFINLDDPDAYLRAKLFKEGLGNVTIAESKLLLAAKLSLGRDLQWWKGIVNETIKPLNLLEHLALLIENPQKYQTDHDEDVYKVFKHELYDLMGRPDAPTDAPNLLRDLSNSILDGLAMNTINDKIREIYEWWSKNTDLIPVLRLKADAWPIPSNALPQNAHPDHPFAALDRKMIIEIGERLRNNDSFVDLTEALRKRIGTKTASVFKPEWLKDLLTLLEFDTSSLYRYDTLPKLTEYYRSKFTLLDTAMRHLYSVWLSEPNLLRPLQELYETHMKSLLDRWFSFTDAHYEPTQLGLIRQALDSDKKTAVLVCDGLRLEIAQAIARRLPKSIEIKKEIRYAKLPSVTENGMSALFGVDEVVNSTANRYDRLRQDVTGVEIISYLMLGAVTDADKLVVMYGDIDQVGEHKGLAGLKDINNYEGELTEAIRRLLQLGYEEVYLTADHGFVITGLLDEASKVPAPEGADVKERFCLSNDEIRDTNLIQREDTFPGSRYQYYARTDRPFKSRGAYGYAHGGFTPQECLIPFYRFSSASAQSNMEVRIINKEALTSIAGQFFSVRLKGNDKARGERVKVCFFLNGVMKSSAIVRLNEKGDGSAEFESIEGNASIVVQSTTMSEQYDNAEVRKSTSRDLDGLL